MSEFVKICPRCGHTEPEYENVCSQCDQFIGMEPSVAKSSIPSTPIENPKLPEQPGQGLAASGQANANGDSAAIQHDKSVEVENKTGGSGATASSATLNTALTQRYVATSSFYLEVLANHQVLTVEEGATLGQAHDSSHAAVQIDSSIHGADYIHRQHCRFDHNNNSWQVVAIDQSTLGSEFTNPTRVNQLLVPPGQSLPLRNGDELQLSGVKFRVKTLG